jgi:hypothetical protein
MENSNWLTPEVMSYLVNRGVDVSPPIPHNGDWVYTFDLAQLKSAGFNGLDDVLVQYKKEVTG